MDVFEEFGNILVLNNDGGEITKAHECHFVTIDKHVDVTREPRRELLIQLILRTVFSPYFLDLLVLLIGYEEVAAFQGVIAD